MLVFPGVFCSFFVLEILAVVAQVYRISIAIAFLAILSCSLVSELTKLKPTTPCCKPPHQSFIARALGRVRRHYLYHCVRLANANARVKASVEIAEVSLSYLS